MSSVRYVITGVVLSLLVLLVFGVLNWMSVPTGAFLDWMSGLLMLWWLIVLVTVPWNIYFKTREVIDDAEESKDRGITLREDRFNFVKKLSKRSLTLAIGIHLVSASVMYLLSWLDVTPVGYFGSAAALLLTGLRPGLKYYEHIMSRLRAITKEFHFPRDDIRTLQGRIKKLESTILMLDTSAPKSWASCKNVEIAEIQAALTKLQIKMEETHVKNQADHQAIRRDTEEVVAQITEDGRFLNHAREVIRFFKNA